MICAHAAEAARPPPEPDHHVLRPRRAAAAARTRGPGAGPRLRGLRAGSPARWSSSVRPATTPRRSPRQPGARSPARNGSTVSPCSSAPARQRRLGRLVVVETQHPAEPRIHVAALGGRAADQRRATVEAVAPQPRRRRGASAATIRSAAEVPTLSATRVGSGQSEPTFWRRRRPRRETSARRAGRASASPTGGARPAPASRRSTSGNSRSLAHSGGGERLGVPADSLLIEEPGARRHGHARPGRAEERQLEETRPPIPTAPPADVSPAARARASGAWPASTTCAGDSRCARGRRPRPPRGEGARRPPRSACRPRCRWVWSDGPRRSKPRSPCQNAVTPDGGDLAAAGARARHRGRRRSPRAALGVVLHRAVGRVVAAS